MRYDFSAPDLVSRFLYRREEMDAFLDLILRHILGKILQTFHRKFLRGHGNMLEQGTMGFKATKNRRPL